MDPQAIFNNFRRNVTEHYFDLHGRVGRPEFWYFVLANFIFALIAAILQGIAKRVEAGTASSAQAKASGDTARPMAELAWSFAQRS